MNVIKNQVSSHDVIHSPWKCPFVVPHWFPINDGHGIACFEVATVPLSVRWRGGCVRRGGQAEISRSAMGVEADECVLLHGDDN